MNLYNFSPWPNKTCLCNFNACTPAGVICCCCFKGTNGQCSFFFTRCHRINSAMFIGVSHQFIFFKYLLPSLFSFSLTMHTNQCQVLTIWKSSQLQVPVVPKPLQVRMYYRHNSVPVTRLKADKTQLLGARREAEGVGWGGGDAQISGLSQPSSVFISGHEK